MKYSVTVTEMSEAELAALTTFLVSQGAKPAAFDPAKTRQTVAELAAATGAVPAAPPRHDSTPQAAAFAHAVPSASNVQYHPAAPAGMVPPPAPPSVPPVPQAPVAPAAAAAPAAPKAPGAGPTISTTEFDSRGTPHHSQFHADSKRKNADGTWAKRKGVDKVACAAWEATLTGAPQAPAANIPPAPPVGSGMPPAPQGPVGMPAAPTADQINAQFAPGIPPQGATVDPLASVPAAPVAPAAPAVPEPAEEVTDPGYPTWHNLYTNLLSAQRLSNEKWTDICQRYGAVEDPMVFFKSVDARTKSYAELMALTH